MVETEVCGMLSTLGADDASSIVRKFAKDLHDPDDFTRFNDKNLICEVNRALYDSMVDKNFVDFSLNDLAKIYDINNKNYTNRTAKVR